ncbi:hypothetical protein [Micromonospora okii]|uniref:hypothetical protein n=1 Tax=Micromonospora okii TaxID=1182970 RepID=UPI001E4FD781|nr:hypothetical protein [Micromonospora okii]
MALLTATSVPGGTAVTVPSAAVNSTDTISGSDVGQFGALLVVTNGGGSSITVTITDPGVTAVGNAGTTVAQSIPAGARRWLRILPGHVNRSTGVATVAYSGTTSVTAELVRG